MTTEELRSLLKWWESKRLVFNVFIGFIGGITLLLGMSEIDCNYWFLSDILGIFLWGIMANILYSSGILLELSDWYYLKGKIRVKKYRFLLLVLGFTFSCLLTFLCARVYVFSVALCAM